MDCGSVPSITTCKNKGKLMNLFLLKTFSILCSHTFLNQNSKYVKNANIIPGFWGKYKITSVLKVKTDIITSIAASLVGHIMTLLIQCDVKHIMTLLIQCDVKHIMTLLYSKISHFMQSYFLESKFKVC
jgi:hypothetical protein